MVVFSWVAGRFGNAGQADYSAGNDFMCKTVGWWAASRPNRLGIALDWTAWGGIGMATRGRIPEIMKEAGIDMLDPAEGLPVIRKALQAGFSGEAVVGRRLGVLLAPRAVLPNRGGVGDRQELRGHYGYYGITGNSQELSRFAHEVQCIWRKWLYAGRSGRACGGRNSPDCSPATRYRSHALHARSETQRPAKRISDLEEPDASIGHVRIRGGSGSESSRSYPSKAREEYAGLGERGAERLPQLDFEIEVCGRFLPKMAGEDEVRAAVKEAITRLAVSDPKQAGKVLGDIMKTHKGKFEPAMVKRLVEGELAPK